MNKIFIIFYLISFSIKIFANEDTSLNRNKSFQIQAIVYSSLGTGLSLSYRFKKNIWLNFDTQSLSGTMSKDSNDALTREDADYEFQTKYINVRNYLTNIINNLFIQYGIVSRNWETKSIVNSNENSQRKAVYKTNYPTNGINFGIGMNWVFYNGLSSGLYLVRIISEEPSFTYELEEDWECSSSCQSNYESNVKKYTPSNSFYLNFGYNF
uniref:Outer membrane protein beta-barrel domain-containing protein n=1 Tax=uncultured delta proteobacterium HF0130_20J24 TaxID=710829 RepID=E0XXR5_9DELT|nr:hypothetical protein [uncultured delta proteobacterium HF0130_20J24]